MRFNLILILQVTLILANSNINSDNIFSPSARSFFEGNFEQKLDHFNKTDSRTFNQRFFEDLTYFEYGGPAFIYIASELDNYEHWMTNSHIYDLCQKYNGSVFGIEPRFFGHSQAVENLSVENLKYYTIEQVLADMVEIIRFIRQGGSQQGVTKLILYGRALGASYALWIAQDHPDLVDGVLANYPMLKAKVENSEYFQFTLKTLTQEAPECEIKIHEAFDELNNLIDDNKDNTIAEYFHLSNALDTTKPFDVALFVRKILDQLAVPLVNESVEYIKNDFCLSFLKIYHQSQSSVEALGEFFFQFFDVAPLEIGYDARWEKIRNESWESDYAKFGNRVILYRSCTQTSWFQTSEKLASSIKDKFLLYIFVQGCIDGFGLEFDEEFIQNGNTRTNDLYGGKQPDVQKAYITYGGLDPYQLLGPSDDLNPLSPVDVVPLTPRNFLLSRNISQFNKYAQDAQKRADDLIEYWLFS